MKQGLVYVFTGEGKGKTSAAIGVATRALLLGNKVAWVSWYKGRDWEIAEKGLSSRFPGLHMYWTGKGFYIQHPTQEVKGRVKIVEVAGGKGKVVDAAASKEHQEAAAGGVRVAQRLLEGRDLFLLVLDEAVTAVHDGLVSQEEIEKLLKMRGTTHLVLTGRGATPELIEQADLVTECRKLKHPYDQGELAVAGLDY